MFDLWPPVKVIGKYGDSVIRVNDCYESCQMYMDDGVSPVDFLRLWKMESSAICSGRRKRGILATQIERNQEGKWGCVAGWLVFRIDDHIAIYDGASIGFKESGKTFGVIPKDWWRYIRVKRQRLDHAWKKVSVAAFKVWNDRIATLLSATVSTYELNEEECKTKSRNMRIVERAMYEIQGGREIFRLFPSDYMDRMLLIEKTLGHGSCDMGGPAGVHEFDKQLSLCRNVDMLAGWAKRLLTSLGGGALIFLNHINNDRKHVMVSVFRPNVDDEVRLLEILKCVRVLLQGIDYVAFVATTIPDGCRDECLSITMTIPRFRCLLGAATNVLLGICNGTAWATFSLVKQSLQVEPFWVYLRKLKH